MSNTAAKATALFSNGAFNPIAAFFVLITAVGLFFPMFEIPILGTVKLINTGSGKALLILLALLAIALYGGVNSLLVKVLGVVSVLFMAYQLYDIISGLNEAARMLGVRASASDAVSWGLFVNLASVLALLVILFLRKHKVNQSTF